MTAAVTKSAKTLTEQSHDAAIKYQASITAANRRQTMYLETDLPKIFNAMQQLGIISYYHTIPYNIIIYHGYHMMMF